MLLLEQVRYVLREQQNYFVGGNMFIYFSREQARNRDFRGPDFFFVKGVRWDPLRPYWAIWDEGGRYPNVIIELLSPTTAEEDLNTKKDVYQDTFRTPEYYCYDPDTQLLQGWRLAGQVYEPLQANNEGWLWCDQLQLWLGTWHGLFQNNQSTWLRFHDQRGVVVPTFAEAERQRAEAAEAELARLKQERQ